MHVDTTNQKTQTQLADHRKLHRNTFEYSYFCVITTFIEQTAINHSADGRKASSKWLVSNLIYR